MTTSASSKTSLKQRQKKKPEAGASSLGSLTEKPSGASSPRPLSALRPNPKNPRLPFTDAQADAFKRSLAEYGDLSGIVENQRTGLLVGGHKRIEQFLKDNASTIAFTHHLEAPDATGTLAYGYVETGGTRFAYRLVDWPESKEKAANLAANQFGAEFDWLEVQNMLTELDGQVDLSLTGFSEMELKQIQYAGSTEENDPNAEWKGMPGFEGAEMSGIRAVVHFENESDKVAFESLVGQKIPLNTKAIWYPKKEREDMASLRYQSES